MKWNTNKIFTNEVVTLRWQHSTHYNILSCIFVPFLFACQSVQILIWNSYCCNLFEYLLVHVSNQIRNKSKDRSLESSNTTNILSQLSSCQKLRLKPLKSVSKNCINLLAPSPVNHQREDEQNYFKTSSTSETDTDAEDCDCCEIANENLCI